MKAEVEKNSKIGDELDFLQISYRIPMYPSHSGAKSFFSAFAQGMRAAINLDCDPRAELELIYRDERVILSGDGTIL